MKCPKCKNATMEKRTEADVEIDHCPSCHGLWLELLELERLLEIDARSLIEDDKRFGASAMTAEERINCPNCRGTYLIKINSLVRTGTILDSCTVCFGTWLDAGEYARLAEKGFWASIRALFV